MTVMSLCQRDYLNRDISTRLFLSYKQHRMCRFVGIEVNPSPQFDQHAFNDVHPTVAVLNPHLTRECRFQGHHVILSIIAIFATFDSILNPLTWYLTVITLGKLPLEKCISLACNVYTQEQRRGYISRFDDQEFDSGSLPKSEFWREREKALPESFVSSDRNEEQMSRWSSSQFGHGLLVEYAIGKTKE